MDIIGYSHSVNPAINMTTSCRNMCGPLNTCAITGDQCTSDIDCPGCLPKQTTSVAPTVSVPGYEDAGKLSQNIGLHYSTLTNDGTRDFDYINPWAKPVSPPYQGTDNWTAAFNTGLQMYNNVQEYNHGPKSEFEKVIMPKYSTALSATGQFYTTGPPPSNM